MGLLSFHSSPLPRRYQWNTQNLAPGSAMVWPATELLLEQTLPGLPFASWFLSLPEDTSAVHGMRCRVLLLLEPWSWHRGNTTAQASSRPFAPHTSARWEGQMICRDRPSPSSSSPVKQPMDIGEYALEGNAAWITIWNVQFLTYFLCMHLVLWFLSSHFSISIHQKNLGQLSQNSIHCTPTAVWTVLLAFLWSVEMLADMELPPSQSRKVQAKQWNPHLWFSFFNKYK